VVCKVVKGNARYQEWSKQGDDFAFDTVPLPSPYPSSFVGFVEFTTSRWFGLGGVVSSCWNTVQKLRARAFLKEKSSVELPDEMSTTSRVGGRPIAGDSIAALVPGLVGLAKLLE
jgi:hypothetical protein